MILLEPARSETADPTADSGTAEPPLPPCFPEYSIPPEGNTPTELSQDETLDPNELTWNPDDQNQVRFDDCTPLKLEPRGTKPQTFTHLRTKKQDIWQPELFDKQLHHRQATVSKLRIAGRNDLADPLEACRTYHTVALCNHCGAAKRFPNRCDLFYCAQCQPRLARERAEQIAWWARTVKQPKHVVLTIKNITNLSPGHVDEFRKYFTRLRRSKFARNWLGGFYSLEVTYENQGWHLHLHALINARWIDATELSKKWNSITNGLGYIVHVRDCRGTDYLRQVTKYVVKGNQLAAWKPEQIVTFIEAFQGKRTFAVFGQLYGLRTEFSEFVKGLRERKSKCECGCNSIRYLTEEAYEALEAIGTPQPKPRPPPQVDPQLPLLAPAFAWPD